MMFLSAVRLLRPSIPVMRRRSGGPVVLIATLSAFEPRLTYPVSSVIRAALSALVKLCSDRYGREGVRITGISPTRSCDPSLSAAAALWRKSVGRPRSSLLPQPDASPARASSWMAA